MNPMKEVMEKMMSLMVKPEDMPQMMGAMMDRMFSQMTSEDRIAFVSTMMPKCLSLIFAEIDPAAKEKLAREMMGKMGLDPGRPDKAKTIVVNRHPSNRR